MTDVSPRYPLKRPTAQTKASLISFGTVSWRIQQVASRLPFHGVKLHRGRLYIGQNAAYGQLVLGLEQMWSCLNA